MKQKLKSPDSTFGDIIIPCPIFNVNIGDKFINDDEVIRVISRSSQAVVVQEDYPPYKKRVLPIYKLYKKYGRIIPHMYMRIGVLYYPKDKKRDLVFYLFQNKDSYLHTYQPGMIFSLLQAERQLLETAVVDNLDHIKRVMKNYSLMEDLLSYCISTEDSDDLFLYDDTEEMENYYNYRVSNILDIALYIDDTPSIIAKLCSTKKRVYESVISNVQKKIEKLSNEPASVFTLEDLFVKSHIIYSIDYMFDITYAGGFDYEKMELPGTDKDSMHIAWYKLPNEKELSNILSAITYNKIRNLLILRYWYDMDLKSIRAQHSLVRNEKDYSLWLFSFDMSSRPHGGNMLQTLSLPEASHFLGINNN